MKFKIGDEVIFKTGVADFRGVVINIHYYRSWKTLWLKKSYIYDVNLSHCGDIVVRGHMSSPEKFLELSNRVNLKVVK